MTLLSPLALLGLVAAAIPLVIHLFNFRRPKRVDYSSIAFLQDLRSTTLQRVRIQRWLLLLLRTMALAFLVAGFARPASYSGAGWLGGGNWSVVLVLDNSLSMTLRDEQGAYIDQIQEKAAELVAMLDPADEVLVATLGGDSREREGFATELPRGLEATAVSRAVSSALAQAGGQLMSGASHPNRKVYFLGDLQRTTLLDTVSRVMPGGIPVELVAVGGTEHTNVSVTHAEVRSRIVEVGQPVRIEASISNSSPAALRGYVASLYLEGDRVAQATLDLPANQTTTVQFSATPRERGWLAGAVRLEDDALLDDNTHHFTLHVPQSRSVLIVRGTGAETQYVEAALASHLDRGRMAVDFDIVEEARLAATPVASYDVIALLAPESLSSGERLSLARYVEAGGGLLLFPGIAIDLQEYNALLQLLGGGQLASHGARQMDADASVVFEDVDLEHPLFEGVFAEGTGRVESPAIRRMLEYVPRSGTEATIASLSNGFPFLQELRLGQGAAFFFAVAPDLLWSDFPLQGLFVPLLFRSVYYLSAHGAVEGDRLVVGSPASVRVPGSLRETRLHILSPDGADATPQQRNLFGVTVMDIDTSLDLPGTYDIMSGEHMVQRLAVNLDPRESDLRTYAPREAASALSDAIQTRVAVRETPTSGRLVEAGPAGAELWKACLMLALVCLMAEVLVTARWRRVTDGP